ncbi:hypothetical protein [Scytonema sp. NUACC21]
MCAATLFGEFDIIGACEIDDCYRNILNLRYSNLPVARDRSSGEEFGGLRARVVSATLPSRPFVLTGERIGALDDRDLFPHFFARIDTIEPDYIVLANAPGILSCPYKRRQEFDFGF